MPYSKQNDYLHSVLLFGLCSSPGNLLPCPKETVADPLPKHRLFSWNSPVQCYQVHEGGSRCSAWVQSTKATI